MVDFQQLSDEQLRELRASISKELRRRKAIANKLKHRVVAREWARKKSAERRAAGLCIKCGREPATGKKTCRHCLDVRNRVYHKRNPEASRYINTKHLDTADGSPVAGR